MGIGLRSGAGGAGLRRGWGCGRAACTHRCGPAGSGRLHSGEPGEHSPPPPWRPRWEARRDEEAAASLPPLLSPSYKYRLGPRPPPPPTPATLRKVRAGPGPGSPSARRRCGAVVTVRAPAVRLPPQLAAWPPPPPPPASPPGSSPRTRAHRGRLCRAFSCNPGTAVLHRAPSLWGLGRPGCGGGGTAGGRARVSAAVFPISGKLADFLSNPPFRWQPMRFPGGRDSKNCKLFFLTQSQVPEHPLCFTHSAVRGSVGGERPSLHGV